MSKLEVDKIDPQSGTALEIGTSGDTVTIPSGVTLDASNATTSLPATVVTTTGTQTLTNKSIATTQLTGTITPSDSTVSTAKIVDGAVTSAKLASGVGGKILQVVSTAKTDTFTASTTNQSFVDITGLSASITPSSTSSKILVYAKTDGGMDSSADRPLYYRILRGSTVVGAGADVGNRKGTSFSGGGYKDVTRSVTSQSSHFLDTPNTTSAITYKIQVTHEAAGTATVYVNRGELDDSTTQTYRGISVITLMEVSG